MKGKRIFLTGKDLQILTGTKLANCYKTIRHLKDALGKKGKQKITFKEYSEYYGISLEEIYETLSI